MKMKWKQMLGCCFDVRSSNEVMIARGGMAEKRQALCSFSKSCRMPCRPAVWTCSLFLSPTSPPPLTNGPKCKVASVHWADSFRFYTGFQSFSFQTCHHVKNTAVPTAFAVVVVIGSGASPSTDVRPQSNYSSSSSSNSSRAIVVIWMAIKAAYK